MGIIETYVDDADHDPVPVISLRKPAGGIICLHLCHMARFPAQIVVLMRLSINIDSFDAFYCGNFIHG